MTEFFETCFQSTNLPYSALMILVLLYWMLIIFGLFDSDSLDFDSDFDADMDVDAGFSLGSFLHWFHFGELPIMVIISVVATIMWSNSILISTYTSNTSLLVAAGIFIPNLILSLTIGRFLTLPLKKFFQSMEQDLSDNQDLIGKSCIVHTPTADSTKGHALIQEHQPPIQINIRTMGDEKYKRGDELVVIEYSEDTNTYIVTSMETE